jgi:hypothetical protein
VDFCVVSPKEVDFHSGSRDKWIFGYLLPGESKLLSVVFNQMFSILPMIFFEVDLLEDIIVED